MSRRSAKSKSVPPLSPPPPSIHVIFCGKVFVGKTTLIALFSRRIQQPNVHPMVDCSTSFSVDGMPSGKICLWEVPTNVTDDRIQLTGVVYQRADVLCMSFAVNKRESFEELDRSFAYAIQFAPHDCLIFLVGFKSDTRARPHDATKMVSREEAEECAKRMDAVSYIETSSETGEGVRELFVQVVRQHRIRLSAKAKPLTMEKPESRELQCQPFSGPLAWFSRVQGTANRELHICHFLGQDLPLMYPNATTALSMNMVFAGNVSVGKTSLISLFTWRVSHKRYGYIAHTLDCEIEFFVDGISTGQVIIWDVSNSGYGLNALKYRAANVFCLCFAVNNRASFDDLERGLRLATKFLPPGCPIFLVGFKSDTRTDPLQTTSFITREEAEAYATKVKAIEYIETSSETGEGVRQIFVQAVRQYRLGVKTIKGDRLKPSDCVVL